MDIRHWFTISPEAAKELTLPRDDVIGPINELGEPCPWPWEPQQLVDAPMGQYHCPYCGGMVMAGMPHLDWSEEPNWPAEDESAAAEPIAHPEATTVKQQE